MMMMMMILTIISITVGNIWFGWNMLSWICWTFLYILNHFDHPSYQYTNIYQCIIFKLIYTNALIAHKYIRGQIRHIYQCFFFFVWHTMPGLKLMILSGALLHPLRLVKWRPCHRGYEGPGWQVRPWRRLIAAHSCARPTPHFQLVNHLQSSQQNQPLPNSIISYIF